MWSKKEWDSFHRLLDMGLEEDLNNQGDVTSDSIFGEETGSAVLISKDEGVLAGIEGFKAVFRRIDPSVQCQTMVEDGALLTPGTTVAKVSGPVKSILVAERTALNFLSYLSGIATSTRQMVEAARGSGKAIILDTRKTLPGYRILAKYAVRVGGGQNHRLGLHDMVLIKDNHIDAVGSITEAVRRVRLKWGKRFLVEVECRTLDEVKEAVSAGVDRILLDNMDLEQTVSAVQWVVGKVPLESSGDMTLERVQEYARTGVDYISIGRITHSVPSFNFSLKVRE